MPVKPKPISEAHIQQTCSEMLELDDWRRVRTDMKQLRGMGVQEPGMADDLFIRYTSDGNIQGMHPARACDWLVAAEVMWIEWKSKRGVAGDHQRAWQALERKRGALVLLAGEDFPASIEGFRDWYKASGLMRKKIIS